MKKNLELKEKLPLMLPFIESIMGNENAQNLWKYKLLILSLFCKAFFLRNT